MSSPPPPPPPSSFFGSIMTAAATGVGYISGMLNLTATQAAAAAANQGVIQAATNAASSAPGDPTIAVTEDPATRAAILSVDVPNASSSSAAASSVGSIVSARPAETPVSSTRPAPSYTPAAGGGGMLSVSARIAANKAKTAEAKANKMKALEDEIEKLEAFFEKSRLALNAAISNGTNKSMKVTARQYYDKEAKLKQLEKELATLKQSRTRRSRHQRRRTRRSRH